MSSTEEGDSARRRTDTVASGRTCKVRKVKVGLLLHCGFHPHQHSDSRSDELLQCDERRPLCANCERHFTNLIACDFDDQEQTFQPAAGPSAPAPATVQPASVETPLQPQRRSTRTSRLPVQAASPVGRNAEPIGYYLPPSVSAGRIDPFEARPASQASGPSVDGLIGHYLSDFAFRSFPFYATKPLIELWWPFVRSDEVVRRTPTSSVPV